MPDRWWTISESSLKSLLDRAHAGEDPDMLMLEEYTNSDHEYVDEDDDDA